MNPLYHDAIERHHHARRGDAPARARGRHGLSRLGPRPAQPAGARAGTPVVGQGPPAFTLAVVGLGSSMEEDNTRSGDFMTVDDIAPPMNENLYGAMAAKNGAIVTVERIVSTHFIRRHANLVRLPGQYVRAVVETPQGNHPGGMYGMNVPELEGYAEDIEWILECRRAFPKPETADAWKGRAHTDAWVSELETLSPKLPVSATASPSEWMAVAASRMLAEKVQARGFDPRPYFLGA